MQKKREAEYGDRGDVSVATEKPNGDEAKQYTEDFVLRIEAPPNELEVGQR